MKSFQLLAACAFVATSVSASQKVVADVSVGVSQSTLSGQVQKDIVTDVGMAYRSIALDGGVSTPVLDQYNAVLRLKADLPAEESRYDEAIGVRPGYAYQAALGCEVEGRGVSFFVGPVFRLSSVDVLNSANDASVNKWVDSFGGAASINYKFHDCFGVKVSAQHVINQTVSVWDDSDLASKMGVLSTGLSQVGVAVYSDVVYEV